MPCPGQSHPGKGPSLHLGLTHTQGQGSQPHLYVHGLTLLLGLVFLNTL